jgi:hypothetical protein
VTSSATAGTTCTVTAAIRTQRLLSRATRDVAITAVIIAPKSPDGIRICRRQLVTLRGRTHGHVARPTLAEVGENCALR